MEKNKFEIVLDRIIFIGLVMFILGVTTSISLEEIGAGIALVFFLVKAIVFRAKIAWSPLGIPILLFGGGFLITTFVLPNKILPALRGNLSDIWMIPVFFVMLSYLTVERFNKLVKLLLLCSMIMAIYGIIQSFTNIDIIHGYNGTVAKHGFLYDATGFFGLHLTYGGIMSMMTLLFLGFTFSVDVGKLRPFYILGSFLTLTATILSFSRSAIVGVIAGIFTFLLLLVLIIRSRKMLIAALIPAISLILILGFVPPVKERMATVISPSFLKNDVRYEIWTVGLEMAKKNPIWGVGDGQFLIQYDNYKRPGYRQNAIGHPHNDILLSWLNGGIISLTGYLLLFLLILIFGIRSAIQLENNRIRMIALVAASVTMFFQGLSQCYITTAINSWLFWFVVAGVAIYHRASKKNELKEV